MPLLCLLLLGALLAGCASPRPRESITVLDVTEEGGQLTVTTATQTSTLREPQQTADIRPSGKIAVRQTTAAEIETRYGAVLETMPAPERTFVLTFLMGKTTLTPASQSEARWLLEEIATRGPVEIVITGHTDTVGDLRANEALALARAEAVKALLMAQGRQAMLVRVRGYGERQLLVPTPDNTPEPRNRRVEVVIR
jgi:OmpA-OmpF porin, OOP family